MVVPVVADADTLFGGATRGLLIHLDYQGLIRLQPALAAACDRPPGPWATLFAPVAGHVVAGADHEHQTSHMAARPSTLELDRLRRVEFVSPSCEQRHRDENRVKANFAGPTTEVGRRSAIDGSVAMRRSCPPKAGQTVVMSWSAQSSIGCACNLAIVDLMG